MIYHGPYLHCFYLVAIICFDVVSVGLGITQMNTHLHGTEMTRMFTVWEIAFTDCVHCLSAVRLAHPL